MAGDKKMKLSNACKVFSIVNGQLMYKDSRRNFFNGGSKNNNTTTSMKYNVGVSHVSAEFYEFFFQMVTILKNFF